MPNTEEVRMPDGRHLHTTEQAAIALKVPGSLIRKWRHLEKAMPADFLPAAAPGGRILLWDLAELEPLAEAYHRRRQHRRAAVRDRRPIA